MDTPTRAAIYCRVSTEEQAREGFSIAAQKRTLSLLCASRRWNIAGVYADEGLSGKSMERPAFKKLLEDAGKGIFDVVLVWKINRFSRRNADLLNTVEYLNGCSVNLISCCEQFDSSTPTGKLMLSMLGSIGEFERDTIVENIRSGMAERAKQGLFNGGRVLGYDSEDGSLVLNKREALTVRRIFELYLGGNSLRAIEKILKYEHIKTKNGFNFQISSIKRILQNPLYAGYITYNKTMKYNRGVKKNNNPIMARGNHEPIVTEQEFNDVQLLLGSKKQSYLRDGSFILSGKLKCPFCGGTMSGCTKAKKYRYYVCSKYKRYGTGNCRGLFISANMIEEKVYDFLCSIISVPTMIDDICSAIINKTKENTIRNDTIISQLEKELSSSKKTQDKYLRLFEDGEISPSGLCERIKDLSCRTAAIENRIKGLKDEIPYEVKSNAVRSMLPDFKNILISLNFSSKRRLINSVIRDININPSREIECINILFPISDTRYTGYNVKYDVNP